MTSAEAPSYGEKKILILVKQAEHEVERLASVLLADRGLTSSQLKILVILLKSNTGLRQIDIERHFHLTNPTVTGIINTMEKNNLVKRVKNPADGRSKIIVPTEAVYAEQEELLAIYEELERKLTCNLSADERKELARLLNKMMS